jgi:hypothetical protein
MQYIPLTIAFLLSIATVNLAYAPGPVISISPQNTSANPGDTFTISVMISGVTDLYAWEVKLTWEPGVLELNTITEGFFLKSGGMTFPAKDIDNIFGEALFGVTLIAAPMGVSGSGELATLAFTVEEAGQCALALVETALVDHTVPDPGSDIAHSSEDGYFSTPHEANLVRRSAWPEHHHYKVYPGDEDEYMTLSAKVKNVGPADLYVKVVYELVQDAGMIYVVETDAVIVPPGTITPVSADFGPITSLDTGKYAVEAYALYSLYGSTFAGQGTKIKTFSFAVVP